MIFLPRKSIQSFTQENIDMAMMSRLEGGWAITPIAPKASSVHLCGSFEMGSWKEFWKFHTSIYIYIVDSLNLVQVGFTTTSNHGPW
jgi:hypothetical protein